MTHYMLKFNDIRLLNSSIEIIYNLLKIKSSKIITFTKMAKLFSISLSLLILIQSFGFSINDIVQIDEFIEHAQYHNEQFGDNLFVFISKHYGDLKVDHNREHQEEKEDHEKLPFQHQSHISSISVFVLNSNKKEFRAPEFPESKTHHFHYQTPFSSIHLKGILQPPRLS